MTELKKFVQYSIQVLAYSRLGDGVLSTPITRVQTFEDGEYIYTIKYINNKNKNIHHCNLQCLVPHLMFPSQMLLQLLPELFGMSQLIQMVKYLLIE